MVLSSKEWAKFLFLAYYFAVLDDNGITLLSSVDSSRSLKVVSARSSLLRYQMENGCWNEP